MTATELTEVCERVYRETSEFYDRIASGDGCGFKILYGPPLHKAPVCFIGFQPGGGASDQEREQKRGVQQRWPAICEYALNDWPRTPNLATRLQEIFGSHFLRGCVGLNAIFFRARSKEQYGAAYDASTRRQIQRFCLTRTAEIIGAIDPRQIVTIGFDAMALFGPSQPDIVSHKGRALTRTGAVSGRPALAIMHLTGARIASTDREKIAGGLRELI